MENTIFTCTREFKERFHKLVPKGLRSELIVKLLTIELDKRDKVVTLQLMREEWLKETPLCFTFLTGSVMRPIVLL